MQGTKIWYESTTIISGIIAFLTMLVKIFEVDLDNGIITEFVTGLFGLVAIGMTIYGRIKAKYLIK